MKLKQRAAERLQCLKYFSDILHSFYCSSIVPFCSWNSFALNNLFWQLSLSTSASYETLHRLFLMPILGGQLPKTLLRTFASIRQNSVMTIWYMLICKQTKRWKGSLLFIFFPAKGVDRNQNAMNSNYTANFSHNSQVNFSN